MLRRPDFEFLSQLGLQLAFEFDLRKGSEPVRHFRKIGDLVHRDLLQSPISSKQPAQLVVMKKNSSRKTLFSDMNVEHFEMIDRQRRRRHCETECCHNEQCVSKTSHALKLVHTARTCG